MCVRSLGERGFAGLATENVRSEDQLHSWLKGVLIEVEMAQIGLEREVNDRVDLSLREDEDRKRRTL